MRPSDLEEAFDLIANQLCDAESKLRCYDSLLQDLAAFVGACRGSIHVWNQSEGKQHMLPERILSKIDPADRAKLGPWATTADEAIQRQFARLERQEQRTLANWLALQEEAGLLVYDWSKTNQKATCRRGMPDFKIYREGRVLLGEMKIDKARLSAEQQQVTAAFLHSGTEVQIWDSADTAIRRIKNWLWESFRIWPWETEDGH